MSLPDTNPDLDSAARLDAFLQAPTHALLLTGADQATQITARNLAAKLLSVKHLENQAYYREITPEKDSIGIEQIRSLIAFFRLKVPGDAKIKRAAVIQNANAMGLEAQNALLKLLEEPPADSVLILTGRQPQSLLATIRSRVQIISLPDITQATPEAEALQLVKQVLAGSTYDRLLLVDGLSKQKDTAAAFVSTLATVAMASLESAAHKGNSVERWRSVLQATHTAEGALMHSGNTKLVLTELMLAM